MKPAFIHTEQHCALLELAAETFGDRERFRQHSLLAEVNVLLEHERQGFEILTETQRLRLGTPHRGSYAELQVLARQSLRLMRKLIVPRMIFAHSYATALQIELLERTRTEPKFAGIIELLESVGDCESEAFAVGFDRLLTARAEAINDQWHDDPTALIALIASIEAALNQPNSFRNNGCDLVIALSELLDGSGINLRNCPLEVSPELNPFVRLIESHGEQPEIQTMTMLCSLIAWMLVYELGPASEYHSEIQDESNEDNAHYAATERRLRQAVRNLGVFCSRAVFDLLQMNVFAYSGLHRSCPTPAQAFCKMFGNEDSLANGELMDLSKTFKSVCDLTAALHLVDRL